MQNLAQSTGPQKGRTTKAALEFLSNMSKHNVSRIGRGKHPVYSHISLERNTSIKVDRNADVLQNIPSERAQKPKATIASRVGR